MKNLFFLASLIFIASTVFGQTRPPKKIRVAFEERMPQAQDVKWKGEGDRFLEWTAKYTVDSDSMMTRYDHKANWELTVKYIDINKLPEKVVETIMEEYMSADIKIAAELQEPDFDGYAAVFYYKKDRWAAAITPDGKIYRRTMSSEGFNF